MVSVMDWYNNPTSSIDGKNMKILDFFRAKHTVAFYQINAFNIIACLKFKNTRFRRDRPFQFQYSLNSEEKVQAN